MPSRRKKSAKTKKWHKKRQNYEKSKKSTKSTFLLKSIPHNTLNASSLS
jgi:hypothetical protein